MKKTFALLLCLVLLCLGLSFAHKPFFPEAGEPIRIDKPIISQAHYLQFEKGSSQTFIIPVLEQPVPIEVLVLDNDLGRSLVPQAIWVCEGESKVLSQVDQPFYEGFSKLQHRYKVADSVGPTASICEVRISEASGQTGPYTFAIGIEERFEFGDMLGFFSLAEKLERWQNGQ